MKHRQRCTRCKGIRPGRFVRRTKLRNRDLRPNVTYWRCGQCGHDHYVWEQLTMFGPHR